MEVCGDQYLPIRLDLSSERTRQALSKSGTIFVKKRTSHKNKVCSIQKKGEEILMVDGFHSIICSCQGVASLLVTMALEK